MSHDIVKIDDKYRITITKRIRNYFIINPGDEIHIKNFINKIVLWKAEEAGA